MGRKTIYLPPHIPVNVVTLPGSARMRIEIEGMESLAYDPEDKSFVVFDDPKRSPVRLPLSAPQTRALLRQLAWYADVRTTMYKLWVPEIDLDFRPTTYFGPLPLETHLLSHVTGRERREILRSALASGASDVPPGLVSSTLDDETREAIGRIHPALMGGEYLLHLLPNETEIVRISLASVTADQISVRARRLKHRVAYRIVDEYSEDGIQYRCRTPSSTQPLTLLELVTMIDHASADGGPVFSPLILNIRGGGNANSLRGFVTVRSEFYPQLGAYYAHRIDQWFEINQRTTKAAESPVTCPEVNKSKPASELEDGIKRAVIEDRKNLNAFVNRLNNGGKFDDMADEIKAWWMKRY